jgi:nucleotide-binding universal stress UspA family protein
MNSPKGRIVIGVDGSDASLDALRWALRQAKVTDSDVEAVTSWSVPNQFAELVAEKVDWNARATSLLEEALAKVEKGGIRITQTVTQGHPAAVLTDASTNSDLLVVGSRGHGGFAGMLLGSVSEHVSAHADCPVVVVRHHERQSSVSR